MGVSSSLIAAAIVYWVTEHKLLPTLIIGGAGIAGAVLSWFFTRKAVASAPVSYAPINQDVKLEVSPHVSISPQFNAAPVAIATPTPTTVPQEKHKPRCNINFIDVRLGAKTPESLLPIVRADQREPFVSAVFENQAVEGEELRIPSVKARVIFRNAEGHATLDLSNVAWIPGTGHTHATLEANTPQYLLLFSQRLDGRLCTRTVQPVGARIGGMRRRVKEYETYQIEHRIATIEVQLLTHTERLYGVLLNFEDGGNGLPQFTGFREL